MGVQAVLRYLAGALQSGRLSSVGETAATSPTATASGTSLAYAGECCYRCQHTCEPPTLVAHHGLDSVDA